MSVNRLLDECLDVEREGDYVPPPSKNGHAPMFTAMDGAELAAAKFSTDYLIPGLLAANQPCILAGGKKCLKTTLAEDLAISLSIGPPASAGRGAHFLGYWPVARKCRVALMSGESGMGTIQETAFRIAAAAGVQLQDLDYFMVTDKLPLFGNVEHEIGLERFIVDYGVEVLLYRSGLSVHPDRGRGGLAVQDGAVAVEHERNLHGQPGDAGAVAPHEEEPREPVRSAGAGAN